MMEITRTLHATDFSPTAATALKYSIRLAHALGLPLDIVHVVPSIGPARFEMFAPDSAPAVHDKTARDVLTRFEEYVRANAGPETDWSRVNLRYWIGYAPLPGPAILDLAGRTAANLIILGAHGERTAGRERVGSVAIDMIQRAACPVMLVPAIVRAEAADENIQNVVAYVTLSSLVEPVVTFTLYFAEKFGAHVDVLALEEGTTAGEPDDDFAMTLERQLWKASESCAHHAPIPYRDITLHMRGGGLPDDLMHFLDERVPDMLILEAPSIGGTGSPAERMVEQIVNESPCPVVVVNSCTQQSVPLIAEAEAFEQSVGP